MFKNLNVLVYNSVIWPIRIFVCYRIEFERIDYNKVWVEHIMVFLYIDFFCESLKLNLSSYFLIDYYRDPYWLKK